MNPQLLTIFPSSLDEWGAGNVHHLFLHIELHQSLGLIFDIIVLAQFFRVFLSDYSELGEPGLKRSVIKFCCWGLHSAAAVVSCNKNISHLQNLNCVLNYSQWAYIGRRSDVGNISQNKKFSQGKAEDLVGWYSWIWASNPKIGRALGWIVVLEKILVHCCFFCHPFLVTFKDLCKVGHVCFRCCCFRSRWPSLGSISIPPSFVL